MKDENIFSRNLNNLDDADVEKISETVPPLDKRAKKRILEKCMSRMAETDFEAENTVSGTEKYSKPHIMRYISTAAACLLAAISIGGMVLINRNMGSPIENENMSSQIQTFTENTISEETTVSNTTSSSKNVITVTTFNDEIVTIAKTDVEPVTVIIDEIETDTAINNNPIPTVNDEINDIIAIEPPTEIPTTEKIAETTSENKSFAGEYGDKTEIDYGTGSNIKITETGDNSYDIYIGFFRVIGFEITGSVNDDGILIFTTQNQPEIYGELVFEGEIRLNDDGCILTITKSENNPIDDYSERQYYRIS